MANAREAIELVIEDRLARGEPIPPDVQPKLERRCTIARMSASVSRALKPLSVAVPAGMSRGMPAIASRAGRKRRARTRPATMRRR